MRAGGGAWLSWRPRAAECRAAKVSLLSVTVAPERGLIFGGYDDGCVAVWSDRETEARSRARRDRAHSWGDCFSG